MSSDVFWTIQRKDKSDVVSEYALTDPSNLNVKTRGDTSRFSFHFSLKDTTLNSDLTIPAGEVEQFGDLVIGSGVTVTVNGTLTADTITNNGTLIVNGEVITYGANLIDELLKWDEWAGKFASIELLSGETKYREQFTTTEIDTLLVGIEPSSQLQSENIDGVWGLITQVTDQRDRALADDRIEIEITVLAELSDYADHTAVENDLLV